MKKMTAILMLTAMLLCTACGNSDTGTSDSSVSSTVDNNSVSQANNNDSSNVDDSSTADIEDNEIEDEGYFFEWRGISMYVPTGFEDANEYARRIYEKELDSGTMVYYDIVAVPDYGRIEGTDTYELENVPEILKWYIVSDMSRHFDIGESSTFVPEIDELVELLGATFIHQTGTIDVMYCGAPADPMYYSIYYGMLDLESDEKVPFCWMSYSDDESTRDELASIVDIVAEKVSWIEEN